MWGGVKVCDTYQKGKSLIVYNPINPLIYKIPLFWGPASQCQGVEMCKMTCDLNKASNFKVSGTI